MLTVYDSPTHLFSPVHLSFSALNHLEQLSHLQQNPVPLQFPLPDVVIATDNVPTHWAFISYQLMYPGLVLCVGLILPCKSFRQLPWCCIGWFSAYLVRWLPCIWITALQKLNCVIKVVHYLLFFQGWTVGYRVWLTSTVWLLFQCTFLPISMWRPVISHGVGCFWSGIFCRGCKPFLPWDLIRSGSAGILICHSMLALLPLGNTTTSRALGLTALPLH